MGDFLERAAGVSEGQDASKFQTTSAVVTSDDLPELGDALNVIMFYAMNRPDGRHGGVRRVGEKCTILMPGVEAVILDKKTGTAESVVVGDYAISIERVK